MSPVNVSGFLRPIVFWVLCTPTPVFEYLVHERSSGIFWWGRPLPTDKARQRLVRFNGATRAHASRMAANESVRERVKGIRFPALTGRWNACKKGQKKRVWSDDEKRLICAQARICALQTVNALQILVCMVVAHQERRHQIQRSSAAQLHTNPHVRERVKELQDESAKDDIASGSRLHPGMIPASRVAAGVSGHDRVGFLCQVYAREIVSRQQNSETTIFFEKKLQVFRYFFLTVFVR